VLSGVLKETIGAIEIPELRLESGKVLKRVKQVYAMYGSLDVGRVVLVCHALTGSHHALVRIFRGCLKPGGIL